ncbi:MAG TPA: 16S rRNA (uracil(1498)-N(3))-methyltransferase, partial [Gammaproteobacteria bacterium]|nr:16S rRNA (uracil(1498)-N(3))-methyltransferase [Gammaproteobacteria bacterium]
MNLLLVSATDFIAADRVRITDRRLHHLNSVNKASVGQTLRAGCLGGLQGQATLLSIDQEAAELQVCLQDYPPEKLPITLILALPRPKMLRRTLQTIASMGVAKLVLINSYRVEKSFWQTPFLQPEA